MTADPVNAFLDPELGDSKMTLRAVKEMGFEIEFEEESDSEGSDESDGDQDVEDQYVVA